MIPKLSEKEKAIKLRKDGFSYSEILKEIPVAKSTLSLWLKSVGLAKDQKQKITKKRIAGALRGAKARKDQRIKITREIKNLAKKDVESVDKKNLWLIGISLYWAEGAKEKENGTRSGIKFSNSDPKMILLFLKWLKEIISIKESEIVYELYIHENSDIKKAQKYWSNILSIKEEEIRTYFKKNKIKTVRKNIGDSYNGLICLRVKKSTNLNRKVSGWVEGICEKAL
ncbi:MAG: hypothetical protein PHH21_00585 [Candidatus Pacebacteria bacterium]|nr:hypothetical protein [Candidatus Paceibacterota bacterium]